MKRVLLLLVLSVSLSSCIVTKDYINNISKSGKILKPNSKSVLVTGVENIRVNNFKKTFKKNYETDTLFVDAFINNFTDEAKLNDLYSNLNIDRENNWELLTLNKKVNSPEVEALYALTDKDLLIIFSNFEITNRVETSYVMSGGANNFGGGHTQSTEYCIVNAEVLVYDLKNKNQILSFVTTGESSVIFFDYTNTLLKAKERAIKHAVNYLRIGKITYDKY